MNAMLDARETYATQIAERFIEDRVSFVVRLDYSRSHAAESEIDAAWSDGQAEGERQFDAAATLYLSTYRDARAFLDHEDAEQIVFDAVWLINDSAADLIWRARKPRPSLACAAFGEAVGFAHRLAHASNNPQHSQETV